MEGSAPRTPPPSPLAAAREPDDGERIEALLDEIEARAAPELWSRVEELVERLCEMYGEGLRRALTHLGAAGKLDDDVRERLCGDELLASLLLLHGLHPEPTAARVTRALDAARPTLAAHRGDVELCGVEDGVVRLRLLGSCDGCSSSSRTLAGLLERVILEAAPEVTGVALEEPSPGAVAHRPPPSAMTSDASLVQIGGTRKAPAQHDVVRCELCGAPAGGEHPHVVDREGRAILCACRACALLFERQERGRYRTVPRRVLVEPTLSLTPARLSALGVPVQLAFVFFHSTLTRWVALYPSPAGPTEAVLDDEAVAPLLAASALARALEPDVEALLVYGRMGEPTLEAFLAPIDDCYDLVGLVRRSWRGVNGGDEARRDIEAFFRGLRLRARPLEGGEGAP